MKKIEKTFWINSANLNSIKRMHPDGFHRSTWHNDTFTLSARAETPWDQKITISFEVPEKKVTISESDFEKAWCECEGNNWRDIHVNLKQKLFGERND